MDLTTLSSKNSPVNINSAVASGGFTLGNKKPTLTLSPVVPAPVPTKAPAVTPVVSSSTATNQVNTKIVPAMNNANTAIQTAAQIAKDKATADALALQNKKPVTPPVPLTPEQEAMKQPDAGYQWVYDKATGAKTQALVGSALGPNQTTIDVTTAIPVDTTTSSDGNITFKKLPDGSYGKYDTTTGQYMGMSNETQFNTIKTGKSVADAYNNAITNGALLNESQKSQIQAIKDTYQRILDQQAKDNANFTGATTVAQNLYGIGASTMGLGNIKSVVDAGAAKIGDITSKMNSDVARMTQAFQSDNLAALKGAYDSYVANSSSLQKEIDTQHETARLEADKIRQQKETRDNAIMNDINSFQAEVAKAGGPENPDAYYKALASQDYSGMVAAAGNILTGGIGGEYNLYKKDELARGTPEAKIMSFNQYGTADANRRASIARAGASIASGTDMTTKQQSVFNSIINNQQKSPLIMANDRAVILKNITNEVAKDPSNAALQVSFIYSMIQALDTYQSAVREGEINLVQGTQGLGEKLGNVASQVEKGNPLNPSKIAEYVKVSKTLTDSINNAAQAKKNNYKGQAMVNGIGAQYEQWDNTVSNLNKTTVGSEYATTEEEAKKSVIDFGNTHPDLRPQMIKMQQDKMSYQDIQAWVNQQQ